MKNLCRVSSSSFLVAERERACLRDLDKEEVFLCLMGGTLQAASRIEQRQRDESG